MIDHALALGGVRVSLFRVRWNIYGRCSNPYCTELYARPYVEDVGREFVVKPGVENTPQILEIWTRCRRCPDCLRTRQRRWAGAAIQETRRAPRTWFGTLTLEPAEQFKALVQTVKRLESRGVDYETLSVAEQFVERHTTIGDELTRYLKRVRKNSGARFRYLLVAEKHESGDPHYHMLVHERVDSGKVLHRHLSEAWRLGFERWRLSDPRRPSRAVYLCKYLSKSLEARVRASQAYGGASSDYHTQVLNALMGVVEGSGSGGEADDGPSPSDPHYRF